MTDSIIHLRVPAAQKGRWIQASRSAGLRLTDWIVQHVEAAMPQQLARITIPADITFADLRLARDPDGHVSFDWPTIERICAASAMDPAILRDDNNAADMIVRWYETHLRRGGARDPVADDLVAEIVAEDARGGGISHTPGIA